LFFLKKSVGRKGKKGERRKGERRKGERRKGENGEWNVGATLAVALNARSISKPVQSARASKFLFLSEEKVAVGGK
jgi:hypothetical protein